MADFGGDTDYVCMILLEYQGSSLPGYCRAGMAMSRCEAPSFPVEMRSISTSASAAAGAWYAHLSFAGTCRSSYAKAVTRTRTGNGPESLTALCWMVGIRTAQLLFAAYHCRSMTTFSGGLPIASM